MSEVLPPAGALQSIVASLKSLQVIVDIVELYY